MRTLPACSAATGAARSIISVCPGASTSKAAFDVLETEPQWMEQLWANTRFWKKELGLLGFNIGGQTTPASETPITPIIIGDGRLTMDFSRELFKQGVLGTGI